MAWNNSLSEWYRILWEKIDKDLNGHSNRLRKNKKMLMDKWTEFYLKKYREKYIFRNIKEVKDYLDENVDLFCDYLEDNTYNEDIDAVEFIVDSKKSANVGKFWRDFHEMVYDLEEYDPVVEREKWIKQSKTKKVKKKTIANLIDTLKMKMRRKK